MNHHSATVAILTDQHGTRCVVTEADPVIWLADELLAEIRDQAADERIPGSAMLDGDLLTFGTPGEGLGQLTYRRAGPWQIVGEGYTAYVREPRADADQGERAADAPS